jgi:hypothetical protein
MPDLSDPYVSGRRKAIEAYSIAQSQAPISKEEQADRDREIATYLREFDVNHAPEPFAWAAFFGLAFALAVVLSPFIFLAVALWKGWFR